MTDMDRRRFCTGALASALSLVGACRGGEIERIEPFLDAVDTRLKTLKNTGVAPFDNGTWYTRPVNGHTHTTQPVNSPVIFIHDTNRTAANTWTRTRYVLDKDEKGRSVVFAAQDEMQHITGHNDPLVRQKYFNRPQPYAYEKTVSSTVLEPTSAKVQGIARELTQIVDTTAELTNGRVRECYDKGHQCEFRRGPTPGI